MNYGETKMAKQWYDINLKLKRYGGSLVFTFDRLFAERHGIKEDQIFDAKICVNHNNSKGDNHEQNCPITQ